MNRILIASAAFLAFAGIASAERAPFISGNYSANVIEAYNGSNNDVSTSPKMDSDGAASMAVTTTMDGDANLIDNDTRSGR